MRQAAVNVPANLDCTLEDSAVWKIPANKGDLAEFVHNRLADARLVDIVEHVVAELRGNCGLWHLKHQPHGGLLTAVYDRGREPAPHHYEHWVVSLITAVSERE